MSVRLDRHSVYFVFDDWGVVLAWNYDLTPWTGSGLKPKWFGWDLWTEWSDGIGGMMKRFRLCLGLVAFLWTRPVREA